MKKPLRKLIVVLILSAAAVAQNSQWQRTVFARTGVPANQATVTVCADSESNTPPFTCSTPITIYSTPAGAAKINPFSTDIVGNYSFYAPSGYVTVKETYLGVSYIYKALLPTDINTNAVQFGDLSGFLSFATVPYLDAAVNFWGALNRPIQSGNPNQLNTLQVLTQDDSGVIPNEVAVYATFIDNHTSGTRASNVAIEGDVYNKNSGTTTGQAGVTGYSEVSAGNVGNSFGLFGNGTVKAGAATNNAGVYGISTVSGGTLTNSYAGLFAGPSITGGTVANNYGVYIGAVGSLGATTNFQFYSETNTNPVTIRNDGFMGVGTAAAGEQLTVSGIGQSASTFNTSSGGASIGLEDTGATSGSGGAVVFSADTGNSKFAAIKGIFTNGANNSQGDIGFFTRSISTDSVLTEAARITTSGRVKTPVLESTIATGTAPLVIASTTPVVNLSATPTTYNAAGTQQVNSHIVIGVCTLGTSCSVTLAGSAVFTNISSYQCSATDESAAAAVKFVPASGSAFALTGTSTDILSYVCVGK